MSIKRTALNMVVNAACYGNGWIKVNSGRDTTAFSLKSRMMVQALSRISCSICSRRSCAATARSTSGTSLGLAIVQRIIDAHAGKLEIGRSARQGLRIRAYLPLPVASIYQGVSKTKAAGKSAD